MNPWIMTMKTLGSTARLGCFVGFMGLCLCGAARAAPLGTEFTYQGQLKESGRPASGFYDFQFKLFDASVAGTQLGDTLTVGDLTVASGLFTVSLDFGGVYDGNRRWLGVAVRPGDSVGPYTPLTPRQELTGTPHALFALNVPVPLTLSGTSATHIIRGENASTASGASGVLGLATATGVNYGVYGRSDSIFGTGVYGEATTGVYGKSVSIGGRGVEGQANHGTGVVYGGHFSTGSSQGRGVFGFASYPTGVTYGVYGLNYSSAGYGVFGAAEAYSGATYGVYGRSDSTSGHGVHGEAYAFSGTTYGVYGESRSPEGRGVFGSATAATGVTFGGLFENASTSGRGVFGWASATSGPTIAVFGQSDSTSGAGVSGLTTAGSGTTTGVWGQSNSPDGTGVYGTNANTSKSGSLGGPDYGVKSSGDLVVENGAYRGTIGPNNGAPFPRPAYDSGWVSIAAVELVTLMHNIGGNPDDYLVDLTFKDEVYGRTNIRIGSDFYIGLKGEGRLWGAYWESLDSSIIEVYKGEDDLWLSEVRVRIWVVK